MDLSLRDIPHSWWRTVGMTLLLLLGVYALMPGLTRVPQEEPLPLQLRPLPDASGHLAQMSRDGRALRLDVAANASASSAELRFVLPPPDRDSAHWVVWIPRVPLQSVRLEVEGAWDSGDRNFLRPEPQEGPLPVAYLFRLPSTWEGEIRLRMTATGLRNATLRPQVMSEQLAGHQLQKATIVTSLAYASLFTLGLMTMALFFASRDRSFLSFFAFCLAGGLLVAVYNGHMALLDPLGLFAILGGSGLHAASLLFEVAALRIVLRYTELGQSRPELARAIEQGCVLLLLLAGVLIAWRERLDPLTAWLVPALWLVGTGVGLYVLADAWRRRVLLAGAVFVSTLGIGLSALAWELGARGLLPTTLTVLYGYQAAIMISAAMVSVGLISRISRYREQRDREQRARADSERRMYREAVRSELLTALQMGLRGVAEEEIQPQAMRLLLEHLRRIVPADRMLAVVRGFHGRDTYAAHPAAALDALVESVVPRLPQLRQKLAIHIDVQQPVTRSQDSVPVAIEAAVSLPVRAPAWGALVLERAGATVFHPDELAIARELARIAVLQIDEAFTALHLRHTAEVDSLTGALNRRSIDQALTRTFQEAHRAEAPLSVLFVDIDHFKAVNDRHGHACGDHCLREIARLIGAQLGDEDSFGRYGGEEFLVVMPGRQTEMARAIAEQIRVAVETADLQHQERSVRLTVSIGVATRLSHEQAPNPAVERADKALYAAKRAGRNRVSVAPAVFAPRSATA
jgi:diguanylate cyclase (GGDEF)-like protein